jgi:glucosamine--fructose-6-phosphate aminotransferase (isomerizing)
MCGIVGVIGTREAAPIVLDALRRLEYRGYDSAGIATLVNGHIDRRRAEGKLGNLASALERHSLPGTIGIGHTRWATHGAPTESNAHPHGTDRVSLVHNGIIENHAALRAELEAEGQVFNTETDTETVAQLVDLNLKRGMAPVEAAGAALRRLEGAYALAMIFAGHPELIVGAQHGAPLAVGFGDDEMFVGSDALALAPLTRRIAYLRDGDWTVVDRQGARFFGMDGVEVQREVKLTQLTGAAIGKGNYRHFMEKELHEHPAVIGDTLHRMVSPGSRAVALPELGVDFRDVPRITMSACGSAFYAGLVGRWWFEAVARIPTDGDVASEFRYRTPPMPRGGLGLLVSQSGETADTLAAAREARVRGARMLAVANVVGSTLAREADDVLYTRAGPEIAVCSTKAFVTQIAALAMLAISLGRARGTLSDARVAALIRGLRTLPAHAQSVLRLEPEIIALAEHLQRTDDAFFIGRGLDYPVAMEGSLKLKEISYVHSEALAAGELKHGTLALVVPGVPVIAIGTQPDVIGKTVSNVQEVRARGAEVIGIATEDTADTLGRHVEALVTIPAVEPLLASALAVIPLQLLAYHVARLRGHDVDQPRNLAKSVTVE